MPTKTNKDFGIEFQNAAGGFVKILPINVKNFVTFDETSPTKEHLSSKYSVKVNNDNDKIYVYSLLKRNEANTFSLEVSLERNNNNLAKRPLNITLFIHLIDRLGQEVKNFEIKNKEKQNLLSITLDELKSGNYVKSDHNILLKIK
jgi:hypothetical protein